MHDHDLDVEADGPDAARRRQDDLGPATDADIGRGVEAGRPDALGPGGLLHLQRVAGNSGVAGLLAQRRAQGEEGGGPITLAATVPTVLIGGMPAAVANSVPGGIVCVAPAPNGIAVGSATVLIGGFPSARLADLTLHGTPTSPGPGCPTVIVGG